MVTYIIYPPEQDTDTDTSNPVYQLGSLTKQTANGAIYLNFQEVATSATQGFPVVQKGTLNDYSWSFIVTGYAIPGTIAIRITNITTATIYVDNSISITGNGVYKGSAVTAMALSVTADDMVSVESVKGSGTFTASSFMVSINEKVTTL